MMQQDRAHQVSTHCSCHHKMQQAAAPAHATQHSTGCFNLCDTCSLWQARAIYRWRTWTKFTCCRELSGKGLSTYSKPASASTALTRATPRHSAQANARSVPAPCLHQKSAPYQCAGEGHEGNVFWHAVCRSLKEAAHLQCHLLPCRGQPGLHSRRRPSGAQGR